jgi:hypothetical protein
MMKQKEKRNAKGRAAKSVLRLPDLETAKSAVLNRLSCPDAQRGNRHAMDEFVDGYCSEPRLSFSKTVVTRYRMYLESRRVAPGAIKLSSLFQPRLRSDNPILAGNCASRENWIHECDVFGYRQIVAFGKLLDIYDD